MNYHSALAFLDSLTNFEVKLGQLEKTDFSLDSFRKFLTLIGNPQDKLKYVHIAGSKGKGSTALLTAQMLKEAGYRVGLYTSPHLYDVRERIRILQKDQLEDFKNIFSGRISEETFVQVVSRLKDVMDTSFNEAITYFEFLTAVAFLYFAQEKTDIVVLETGLGGRLDATNVVQPLACGITLIDLEHTRILGETLKQIAGEKAGIIKPGCRQVVCGIQVPEAKKVIEARCRECGVPLSFIGRDIRIEDIVCRDRGMSFCVVCGEKYYECRTQLLGKFQAVNTAVAIGLIHGLNQSEFCVSKDEVEKAVSQAVWPVRMEMISDDPVVLIDGAHTAGSSREVAETVKECFSGKKAVLILGMSADKDQRAIIENFSEIVSTAILTRSRHKRALHFFDPAAKKIFFEKGIDVVEIDSLDDAVKAAFQKRSGDDMILASGSLFLAAEVRQIILSM
jgi:dihydrofolate synthase/folylpolyglutamate synthase